MKFMLRGWFLISLFSSCIAMADTINIRVNKTVHPLDSYAVEAIKIALANMGSEYKLVVTEEPITQTRAIERLESGTMDLMWLASNAEVEEQLQPIRFPLLKGLLGHRIFIINPQSQSKYDQVKSIGDLRRLTLGQGMGWPDVSILEDNQFDVITTSKYQNLFYMVEGGRFDGFPRGVLEPWSELAAHPDLDLTVEDKLVVVYKLPFYLFVSKSNKKLANKLMTGLELALSNGDYDKFYYSNGLVVDALTRSGLSKRRAFHLSNPTLTAQTPLDREDYWLDIKNL